jgi:hypothetical protein
MSNKKITDLPAASTLTGAEIIEAIQSGVNVQFALDIILALNNLARVGTVTVGTWNAKTLKRVRTIVTGGFTPDADAYDQITVTGIDAAIAIGAPIGTPTEGQQLVLRLRDDGLGPHALSWNAIYRDFTGAALPATTTTNKTIYIFLVYNATNVKWDVVNVKVQA